MKSDDQMENSQTNEQAMQKLHIINDKISSQKNCSPDLFRDYVGLYVSRASLSEDFFILLCEHNFVQKLFGSAKELPSITILQCFHLLLANSSQLNTLVYLFSQPKLHEFLFESFEIGKESHEAIEYYIQLLKAIIMRMSGGSRSLVKMFCNNRTPSFPLLTAVSTLAVGIERDQLVKVTAQQCVLLLASLLNEKDVGRGYLSELQMVIFYHQLTMQLIKEGKSDQEGLVKYLVDLLGALSHTPSAFSQLMNIIVNIIVFRQVSDLSTVLRFVRSFTYHLSENEVLSEEKRKETIHVLTYIINRLYFSRFVHSTYLASAKILPSRNIFPKQDMNRFFKQRGEELGTLLIQDAEEQDPKLMDNWIKFNRNSEEIMKLKQGLKRSRVSSILGFLAGKASPTEQYLHQVLEMSGLKIDQLKVPLGRLQLTINYKTALFSVEEMLLKHQKQGLNIEEYDAHCNDSEGKFQLNQPFCQTIIEITTNLEKNHIPLHSLIQTASGRYYFQCSFVQKLVKFLKNNIGDYLLPEQPNLSLTNLYYISCVGFKLGLYGNLQRRAKNWLLRKSQELQTSVHQLTIQNDFKFLIQYILDNKANKYLSQPCSYQPTTSLLKIQIQQQVFKYELLRTFIDPNQPSLSVYALSIWKELASTSQFQMKNTFKHLDRNEAELIIRPSQKVIGFEGCFSTMNEQIVFQVKNKDGTIQKQTETLVLFSELPNGFHTKLKNKADVLCQELAGIRQNIEQFIIKIIPSYFEKTHNSLCGKLNEERK